MRCRHAIICWKWARYPISLWKLGAELTWVALGGEVTVGYVSRLRSELSDDHAWISAYTNQVTYLLPIIVMYDLYVNIYVYVA